jgi:hypothetical protein
VVASLPTDRRVGGGGGWRVGSGVGPAAVGGRRGTALPERCYRLQWL